VGEAEAGKTFEDVAATDSRPAASAPGPLLTREHGRVIIEDARKTSSRDGFETTWFTMEQMGRGEREGKSNVCRKRKEGIEVDPAKALDSGSASMVPRSTSEKRARHFSSVSCSRQSA
jgi:hypothetical protein